MKKLVRIFRCSERVFQKKCIPSYTLITLSDIFRGKKILGTKQSFLVQCFEMRKFAEGFCSIAVGSKFIRTFDAKRILFIFWKNMSLFSEPHLVNQSDFLCTVCGRCGFIMPINRNFRIKSYYIQIKNGKFFFGRQFS